MTHLVGAWSLRGEPLDVLLPACERRAMRAQLGRTDVVEVAEPGLWLLVARAGLARRPGAVLAVEGFVAGDDPARVMEVLDRDGAPEGHYSLVMAESRERRITLLRGLSGGERLYHAELGGLLLFSASLRFLLAHPRIERRLDLARVPEAVLSGLVLSGRGTLVNGVEEVEPGHAATWSGPTRADRWRWPGLLEPRSGPLETLAREFRDALGDAVATAAGAARPVAVSLSGGIDSAAVAALAVEAFGADQVVAFTYEFDDPTHPCETPFAVEVCRRLGIRRHVVFQVGLREFLTAIPETVWRAESFVHWPKAFMLQAARTIRRAGFDRFLCGFGIGSHMGYLDDLAWWLAAAPRRRAVLSHWASWHRRGGHWQRSLERLHPGLAAPGWRLLLPCLGTLERRGLVTDAAGFYPAEARALVERVPARRAASSGPLAHELRRLAFDRLFSCIDVTRWEKPMRELGAARRSPAHQGAALPYAYLPCGPTPFVWGARRTLRPGKLLLRTAFRGVLPDSVLLRQKSWSDAVISPAWYRAGLGWMRQSLDGPDPLAPLGSEALDAANRWDDRAPQAPATALRFWCRVFLDRAPSPEPPTWRGMARSGAVRRR